MTIFCQVLCFFQFSVIAEVINHVDSNFLVKYDYPWHKVRSFRNLISHKYFNKIYKYINTRDKRNKNFRFNLFYRCSC